MVATMNAIQIHWIKPNWGITSSKDAVWQVGSEWRATRGSRSQVFSTREAAVRYATCS